MLGKFLLRFIETTEKREISSFSVCFCHKMALYPQKFSDCLWGEILLNAEPEDATNPAT